MNDAIILKNIIHKELVYRYKKEKDNIISIIVDTVNDNLPDNSNFNLELYMQEFKSELYKFPFITITGKSVDFDVPDMNTFKFEGLSGMIKRIMEGDMPIYDKYGPDNGFVEISYEQFKTINEYLRNSTPHFLLGDAYNAGFPDDDPVWVAPYSDLFKRIVEDMSKDPYNIKLDLIPWTRFGEIDVFGNAQAYYESNKDKWVKEVTYKAIDKFKRGLK